jgi:hypothetical protein
MHAASQPLQNLRKTLLNGCSFSCDAEELSIAQAKTNLEMKGIFIVPKNANCDGLNGLSALELENLRNLTRTAKSELGIWIRDRLRMNLAQYVIVFRNCCIFFDRRAIPRNSKGWRIITTPTLVNISLNQLVLTRQVLEEIGDIAVLADVIASTLHQLLIYF